MFLGYQGNKIALVAATREELENNKFMQFDSIEESDVNYTLYDGEYLTPAELEDKQKQAQKAALIEQLDALDLKAIRPLRAKAVGIATEEDLQKLAEYEEQAAQKRQQLKQLGE